MFPGLVALLHLHLLWLGLVLVLVLVLVLLPLGTTHVDAIRLFLHGARRAGTTATVRAPRITITAGDSGSHLLWLGLVLVLVL